VENLAIWGSLGSLKVIGNSTIRQSGYDFLLAFYSNNCPCLAPFFETARYWLKIADLKPPRAHVFGAAVGVILSEFAEIFGVIKLRSLGVVSVMLR